MRSLRTILLGMSAVTTIAGTALSAAERDSYEAAGGHAE